MIEGTGGTEDAGELHDFNPGAGVDWEQSITIPEGAGITVVLQWDEPFYSVSGGAGASSDLDIYLASVDGLLGGSVVAESTTANIGGDASEVVQFYNASEWLYGTEFSLLITFF